LSQNRINKGISLELKHSKEVHKNDKALLVYSKVLRDLGAGQVDLASVHFDKFFGENIIKLFEIKSFAHLGYTQRKRLLLSAGYLSDILGMSCRISVIFDDF